MKSMILGLISALVFTASSIIAPALAADGAWVVDADKSTLTFIGAQSGKEFTGAFESFTAEIVLDPDNLEAASITVTVDTSSGKTGDRQRDKAMPGGDWFDVKNHPQATFVSTAVTALGDGKYEAAGALSIRGVSKELTLPFTLKIDGDDAHATGETSVLRTDYGVGRGEFSTGQWVGLDVKVAFEIFASR